MIKDNRMVLRSGVCELAVFLGGVDVFPEYLDQFVKTYYGRVEDNLDCFDMTGLAGTDLLVGWIFNCTAGVSDRCRYDTLKPVESRLHAPEAPAGESGLSEIAFIGIGLSPSAFRRADSEKKERSSSCNQSSMHDIFPSKWLAIRT